MRVSLQVRVGVMQIVLDINEWVRVGEVLGRGKERRKVVTS